MFGKKKEGEKGREEETQNIFKKKKKKKIGRDMGGRNRR